MHVLVATDIAARGIHVEDVTLVVHVDPPTEHKAYLHRSGRTARAGASGAVVTVSTPDTRATVRALMGAAAISPTTATEVPGCAAIRALTGPRAARVPVPANAAPASQPGPRPATLVPARGSVPVAARSESSTELRPVPPVGGRPASRSRRSTPAAPLGTGGRAVMPSASAAQGAAAFSASRSRRTR